MNLIANFKMSESWLGSVANIHFNGKHLSCAIAIILIYTVVNQQIRKMAKKCEIVLLSDLCDKSFKMLNVIISQDMVTRNLILKNIIFRKKFWTVASCGGTLVPPPPPVPHLAIGKDIVLF